MGSPDTRATDEPRSTSELRDPGLTVRPTDIAPLEDMRRRRRWHGERKLHSWPSATDDHPGRVLTTDRAGRATRDGALERPVARLSAVALLTASLACVAAPAAVALGAPSGVRIPAVLLLLCTGPGIAFVAAAGGRAEIGLVVGTSLAFAALAAELMLWLGEWHPEAALYALSLVCLLTLLPSGIAAIRASRRPRDRAAGGVAKLLHASRGLRGAAGCHALVLATALCAWAISLAGTDLGRMAGIGLLQAVSPAYFVSFALVLVGFAVAAANPGSSPRLLGAYVVALILIVHATTAVLYSEPRYAWTYKHLGVINLIAATGHVSRDIDVYNNWPGFFAVNAWLSSAAAIAPIHYAGWAQLFFNLLNIAAIRFALRALTGDERILWTATFFFVLGNWVGQDYLAPQAFGFALSVVVIGICLRCGALPPRNRGRRGPSLAARLERVLGLVLRQRGTVEARAAEPIGARAAVVAGGVCFVAVVISHQLSPALLVLDVAALALLMRIVPIWVPAAMTAVEAWWVYLAWPFVNAHFGVLDTSGAGAGAAGRNLAHALPGAVVSLYAPLAVILTICVLAMIEMIRRGRTDLRDLVPVCLIVTPVLVVLVQSYNGEGLYRAYLFALPWLGFLAAFSCTTAPSHAGQRHVRAWRLIGASAIAGTCLLFAYFGQELTNHIPADDVRAATWYEQHAPTGSLLINLAPVGPDRLTARYPLVSLADPPSLLDEPGFSGHRLGRPDVARLEGYIRLQGQHRAYVILTIAEENYGRLNGLIPRGSAVSFATALEHTPQFRLVYRRPTAWVFEYRPAGGRAPGSEG
jgi:hypothetical protein